LWDARKGKSTKEVSVMTLQELKARLEATAAKIEAAERSPIQGWGLKPPDWLGLEEWFEGVEIAPPSGCRSETCAHWSHDPAAPTRSWVPREGVLVSVIYTDGDDTYLLCTKDDEVKILLLRKETNYHARIWEVTFDELPEYVKESMRQLLS